MGDTFELRTGEGRGVGKSGKEEQEDEEDDEEEETRRRVGKRMVMLMRSGEEWERG